MPQGSTIVMEIQRSTHTVGDRDHIAEGFGQRRVIPDRGKDGSGAHQRTTKAVSASCYDWDRYQLWRASVRRPSSRLVWRRLTDGKSRLHNCYRLLAGDSLTHLVGV